MSVDSMTRNSAVEILSRVIEPRVADFPPEAARAFLKLGFGGGDRERMHELAVKAQDGRLTAQDEAELENYRRVGHLLELLWSKARLSLKRAGLEAAPIENG